VIRRASAIAALLTSVATLGPGAGCSSSASSTTPIGAEAGPLGSATIEFQVSTSKSYCEQGQCGASSSIAIKDATGAVLARSAGDCYTPCDTCRMLPCPGYACQSRGYAISGETLTWDGTYYAASTCGTAVSCRDRRFAAAGTYTAVMCAKPGTLANDASQVPQCTNVGPAECVEVPFAFPSSTKVVGALPG
jgi:hypothetical protein